MVWSTAQAQDLYRRGPLSVVVTMGMDLATVPAERCPFADDDRRRDYLHRFDDHQFEYMMLTAEVRWHDDIIARATTSGVEHGRVADGVIANAWAWKVPGYPDPDDVIEGSPLNNVVSDALQVAEGEGPDSADVQAAIQAAWAWADPNA